MGKTITEYDDHLFCMITMNHHPLHTNEWFAENETVQKKNVVVGNLVYSLVLGMSVPDVSGAAIANLEVESLLHAKPTFHGDTIYAVTKVLDVKETSKGDRGIVTVETKGINQRGEEVCYFRRKLMVWKRDHAPQRRTPTTKPCSTASDRPRRGTRRCRSMTQAARGFGAGAAAYESARPGYPDEAVATLLAARSASARHRGLRPRGGHRQAHPRRLLELGARVVAVEPVEAMRAGGGGAPGATLLDGTAESIPLADGSVDVVTVAQAFHWFDARPRWPRSPRAPPGGGLAILWNERDERTAWVAEMSRLIHWHERTVSRYQHIDWAAVVAACGRFTPLQEHASRGSSRSTRRCSPTGCASISYIAAMPTAERERLAGEVVALVAAPGAVPPAVRVPRAVVPPG